MMPRDYTIGHARELDLRDPLGSFRSAFVADEPDTIYLDGNSLGRLPVKSAEYLDVVIKEQWGRGLIRSWNGHWYNLASRLGDKIARIIGARPGEVILSDSTSVNLYKLAYGALMAREGRKEIVSDEMNFPTDLYILQGLIKQLGAGHNLRLLGSSDGITPDIASLQQMLHRGTAFLSLSQVAFKSSFLYDMKEVTDLAHRQGALVLWDLSHSAGVVPLDMDASGADMAVGCTYKYLNGGPGSPSFLYVRKELQEELQNPIQGWFGDKEPFEFNLDYREAAGIRKFLAGTPPVISLSALEPALDMILEAGIGPIRKKSELQTEYLLSLVRHLLPGKGLVQASPEAAGSRGSHISLRHREAFRICKALIDPGTGDCAVIPDFREPDHVRLGISPLYTGYVDIFRAVEKLGQIIREELYRSYSGSRDGVT